MDKERGKKKEVDDMFTLDAEYSEKVFLSELKESLEEMSIKRSSENNHLKKTSWRDLFNKDEE